MSTTAPAVRPRVVLVRHGETEWSASWRHTGRTDVPLTEKGRASATALRPVLDGRDFALVLVSPLERARETAALAGFPDARVEEDLVEWNYGDDDGRTSAEIREDRPGWMLWADGPKNGEAITAVGERADRVVDLALGAGGDVLIFAHGHILRILAARWIELPPVAGQRLMLFTGTPSTLGWEHDYRTIEEWNCHAR